MREQLKKELNRLVKEESFNVQYANDILELYDDEINDTSESTAYDKAMQDIDNVKAGEISGRWYIYVYNVIERSHCYYSFNEDLFISEKEFDNRLQARNSRLNSIS